MSGRHEELLGRFRDLPDYPAVRDLAQALWGAGEIRGAAVMIGAGFSRHLDQAAGDAPPPPLWSDFARRMSEDLYPGAPDRAPTDPLRLAEEYRALLGQPALDALVRELVPDRQWRPGPLHRALLELPWADVLTTNWDTLLERAAAEMPDRSYEVVETVDAIARTRAPRIVKLHGSLPSNPPFIVAEEDFRTYPRRFSPFVNMAQQVLLENDLALIGFSGEDPNFLGWAGWVRDQLGASSRRIRLVGVLDLSPSRRRLLESQHVTPIDLAPLVAEIDPADRHRVATEVFLAALKVARPAPAGEWRRSSDAHADAVAPADLARSWAEERLAYPGWLLAPASDRGRVRASTLGALGGVRSAWPDTRSQDRGRVAVEAAWRCATSLADLPDWLVDEVPALVADGATGLGRAERLSLVIATATHTRRNRDWVAFEERIEAAGRLAQADDERAMVAHERCLSARDRLDYAGVAAGLAGVAGPDPAWSLRRASMLAFLREGSRAAETVREALSEIRSRRARDRRSVWLLSREGWAHLMAQTSRFDFDVDEGVEDEDWPQRYAVARCDPWDELTGFDADLRTEEERLAKYAGAPELGFSPGARGSGATGWFQFGSGHLTPHAEMSRAVETVGFARMPNMDVVDGRLEAAALQLGGTPAEIWSALLEVRRSDEGLINRRFGRVAVARMEEATALDVAARLRAAIEYGRPRLRPAEDGEAERRRRVDWTSRTATLIELLSRFAMRLGSVEAEELFRWAATLARDPGFDHWWLFRPLGHLLDRAFEAIAPADRSDFADVLLEFPLPGERELWGIDRKWPDLTWRMEADEVRPVRHEPSWTGRIAAVTALALSPRLLPRTRALALLHALARRDVLTADERAAAAEAVWSVPGQSGAKLPGGSDLLPHVFLDLPERESGEAERAFRADVVAPFVAGTASAEDRLAVAAAAEAEHAVLLAPDEALAAAGHLLAWSPRVPDASARGADAADRANGDEANSIARALDRAVLPRLDDDALDEGVAEALLDPALPQGPDLLEALSGLVARRPGLAGRAFALLRRALAARAPETAYAAARAVRLWVSAAGEAGTPLPATLPSEMAALVAARREPALHPALLISARLVGMGLVQGADMERLVDALDVLEVETEYADQPPDGLRQDTLTLVRAASVRLADALMRAGRGDEILFRWLAAAVDDPVPEVRFALELDER